MTLTPLPSQSLDELRDPATLAGRVFAETPLPWLVVDARGVIVHANPRAEVAFGWPPAELIGQPVEVLVPVRHGERHPALRSAFMTSAHAPRMAKGLDVTALRRDGSEFFAEIHLAPLAVGDERYAMVTVLDVSHCHDEAAHLRDLADRLATANDALRDQGTALAEIDAEKNAVLGMAAHDLRTPLAVVVGYAELLATASPSEPLEAHRELVDVILRTAKVMRRILDDLLDWSAIESGTLRLARYPIDPVIVAADAVALASLPAARQGIPLSLEADAVLPPIDIDPDRISQVLGNLLGNALKYSPSGHPVCLRVGQSDPDSVEFAVIDHGQGISAESVSHLFRPFETGGNRPADGERAIGLGLAIVKRIVDAHHGSITVQSAPGSGSTFRVRLPIKHLSLLPPPRR